MRRKPKLRLVVWIRPLIHGGSDGAAPLQFGSDEPRFIDPIAFRTLYRRRFLLPLRLAFKVSSFAVELRRNSHLS
jgi:hypothetical protein